jgi:hypothetical protein
LVTAGVVEFPAPCWTGQKLRLTDFLVLKLLLSSRIWTFDSNPCGKLNTFMAKILGESGRYVSDEAVRQKRQIIITVMVIIALFGVIEGIILSTLFPLGWLTPVGKAVIVVVAAVGIWGLDKWGDQKLNAIEKRKNNMVRGAAGEIQVGNGLTKLSDDYCVINDVATPHGNLDHVVVGPTGVFVLDSKAWRGIVTSDGKGELLLNGKPTDKAYVRQFVGRMMGVREKALTLAAGMDTHFNAVFVFTAARVEARWGTTGKLHCITDDQLFNYIAGKDFGKKLNAEEISQIAQAFLGLAHMEKEFGREAKVKLQPSRCNLQPVGAN